jgi:hypothetical protein
VSIIEEMIEVFRPVVPGKIIKPRVVVPDDQAPVCAVFGITLKCQMIQRLKQLVDDQGPEFSSAICTAIAKRTVNKHTIGEFCDAMDVDGRHRDAHPYISRTWLLSEALSLEAVSRVDSGRSKMTLGTQMLFSAWGKSESRRQLNLLRAKEGKEGYLVVDESQIQRFIDYI